MDATKGNLQVAQDLLDLLIVHKNNCVGMAANMISVKKRIIALLDVNGRTHTYMAMFNPEIIKRDSMYDVEKGCLSHLGDMCHCKRYKYIKVKYQTLELQTRIKAYTDWTVQIIQHELDHCDGELIE